MIGHKELFFLQIIEFFLSFLLSLADLELEELEAPQRSRPDSLASICKTTRFSEPEIKRMYRGFKAHCPNGVVKEDTFKLIYAQFFPQGGSYAFILYSIELLICAWRDVVAVLKCKNRREICIIELFFIELWGTWVKLAPDCSTGLQHCKYAACSTANLFFAALQVCCKFHIFLTVNFGFWTLQQICSIIIFHENFVFKLSG